MNLYLNRRIYLYILWIKYMPINRIVLSRMCVNLPKCNTNFQFYRFDGFSVVSSAVYSSIGLNSFFNSVFLLTFHKSKIGVLSTRKAKHNGKFSVKEVLSNGTLMPTVCQLQNDLQRSYVLCVWFKGVP